MNRAPPGSEQLVAAPALDAQARREWLRVRLTAWLDLGLAALSIPFLALLVVELAFSPGPPWGARIAFAQLAIWAVFVLAFAVELTLATSKRSYLRRNWLVALSLVLPALRVFRVAQALRVLRGVRAVRSLTLLRLLTTTNRVTRALRELVRTSQFVYLTVLSVLVVLAGAGGMVYFERAALDSRLGTFGEALWWSANVVTTGAGPAEPVTVEGRVLAILLRVFGLAVFGYLTARIALFFLRGTAVGGSGEAAELRRLRAEIEALADEVHAARDATAGSAPARRSPGDASQDASPGG